jgi:ribosomal subunit interface protein
MLRAKMENRDILLEEVDMEIPLQISFHNLEKSEALEERIRKKATRLEQFFDKITSCRVAVEVPHRNKEDQPHEYRVRVDLTVPGREIVATNDPHEGDGRSTKDPYQAIDDAFDATERQLREYAEKFREGRGAAPQTNNEGIVAKLFERDTDEDYGFVESDDGREIYFNENSVVDMSFGDLSIGTRVEFVEAKSPNSPQPVASTVRVTE